MAHLRTIDLCQPDAGDLPTFCARIAERAEADHHAGRKKRPTGRELCHEYTEGFRGGHPRLAAAIYAKTRWSLEIMEQELAEAGLR